MKALSLLALVLVLGPTEHGLASPDPAASVTVNVTGIKTSVGKVIVSLCTKKQFMAAPCTYVATTPARTGAVSVVFNTVAPGRYIGAAHHDLDGDGALKFTITGPAEPAGVSGPERRIPDFDKAAFDVGAEPRTVNVTLR